MNEMLTKQQANAYSPLALAFLGDCVYEQLVREKLILSGNMPAGKLHSMATKRVCARCQSKVIQILQPVLTEDEVAIFKRGRNATGNSVPKNTNIIDYRKATGLEALFGYLHLIGAYDRVSELFEIAWSIGDSAQEINNEE